MNQGSRPFQPRKPIGAAVEHSSHHPPTKKKTELGGAKFGTWCVPRPTLGIMTGILGLARKKGCSWALATTVPHGNVSLCAVWNWWTCAGHVPDRSERDGHKKPCRGFLDKMPGGDESSPPVVAPCHPRLLIPLRYLSLESLLPEFCFFC